MFACSLLFIVKSLYEVQDSHPAGCGDKGLTPKECNEALYALGYREYTLGTWNDRPKGCVIGDPNDDTIYTESYFNAITGHRGDLFKSICFPGIFLKSYAITMDLILEYYKSCYDYYQYSYYI